MDRRSFVSAIGLAGSALWTGSARAQARPFKLQTPTALGPSGPSWSFVVFSNGDLGAVQRQGSKGKTEVHVLSASSSYQKFALQVETVLPATDEAWDFVALPNRNLVAITRVGSSKRTEIHVLDAGKDYGRLKLQTPTPLPESDRRWSFGANADGDLVCVNRLGHSGKTEVHVLDEDKSYTRFKLQTETALHPTDSNWDFGVAGNGDVSAITRQGESGKPEVHVLDAGRKYKAFKSQSPSPLAAVDASWKFAVRANGDVYAVQTAGGASGKTELFAF